MNFYSYSSLYSDLDLEENFVFLYVIGRAMGLPPPLFGLGLVLRFAQNPWSICVWGGVAE